MNPSTILLIEDNPDDILLTQRAFTQNNIVNILDVVRDGAEALDYLFSAGAYAGRDPRSMPILILMDIKLPKLDGLETLRRIRSDVRTKLLPVVVLTSSLEDQDILKSYSLGANSYVRKPVDFQKFIDAVKHLGIYWLAINQPPC
ncbi:MAG: response regulator [bacterium]